MNAELDRLRGLAAWAERFGAPGFTFGEWVGGEEAEPGVRTLWWFSLSDAGRQFVTEMYELGWVRPFDWMKWLGTSAGRRFSSDPDAIGSAAVDDLAKLLTAIIRGERFSDGEIAGAYASGILPAIARRAAELTQSG